MSVVLSGHKGDQVKAAAETLQRLDPQLFTPERAERAATEVLLAFETMPGGQFAVRADEAARILRRRYTIGYEASAIAARDMLYAMEAVGGLNKDAALARATVIIRAAEHFAKTWREHGRGADETELASRLLFETIHRDSPPVRDWELTNKQGMFVGKFRGTEADFLHIQESIV